MCGCAAVAPVRVEWLSTVSRQLGGNLGFYSKIYNPEVTE